MKRLILAIAIVVMSVATMAQNAQKPFSLDLWPKGAKVQSTDVQDTARVSIFLPDKKIATGRAIVVCPGGAYQFLAMQHEGTDWAQFFNSQGIATIVLKYRMPHGNYEVPISDALQAMELVKTNAENWGINPNDIGIMGSSAGGHLASTIATHAPKNLIPNFQILFYPVITMMPDFTHRGSHDNLLGSKPTKKMEREYSNDMQVSHSTPRAFIVLSDDDDAVSPANGVNYYMELFRHGVPASLFVYPTGGHGWGMNYSFTYHMEMMQELKSWLKSF